MTETEPTPEDVSEEAPIKPRRRSLLRRLIMGSLVLGLIGALVAVVGVVALLAHYSRDLPDYRQLANYEPAIVTRVHAGDGSLIREFARQPRLFVPIEAVPDKLKNAFLASEDKNFYEHSGLDYMGLIRSQLRNVYNVLNNRALEGGSTITQQVARNFLLTLDQRIDRKIKEMILTLRIERAYSKDRILELYLNEINFGNRSYGVAQAALNYFNAALGELTTAQMAYLASVPKAPHNYHPVRHHDRALARRNWVLSRMLTLGFIDQLEHDAAVAEPLVMIPRNRSGEFRADYFAEEVRRSLLRMYGQDQLYEGGLSVRTTLEPRLQRVAERTLRSGLIAYDRRHGWRGAMAKIAVDADWQDRLGAIKKPLGEPSWMLGVIHEVREASAIVGLKDGSFGVIALSDLHHTRPWKPRQRLGATFKDMAEVLELGDVVAVALKSRDLVGLSDFWRVNGEPVEFAKSLTLEQAPDIQGSLVAMDPHTGRVLALVGGYDFDLSQYNRATQAERQPGSAFKPFVYAAALEKGFTPASLVLDAPFVIDQGQGQGKWKPKNSSNKFYGPSTLRLGIEKSRNLMTVRLAQNIGMSSVMNYASRFNLARNMEGSLAASLGAGEVTLIDLTAAYGMLVNGGKKVRPTLIDRIQDRRGMSVYRHDERDCGACRLPLGEAEVREPDAGDVRERIVEEMTAYQMVAMMEGVVQNGTGRKIRVLGKPLAGKTGTTNDEYDAWFVGFSPDLVVGVFTGFDRPRSLGIGEEGSAVAVPIFRDFMRGALDGQPAIPFRVAPGIRLVRINADTGLPARPGDKRVILEAFKPGTEPRFGEYAVLDGSITIDDRNASKPKTATGIY